MGFFGGRREKLEHWTVIVPDGVTNFQIDTSNHSRPAFSWQNDTSMAHSHVPVIQENASAATHATIIQQGAVTVEPSQHADQGPTNAVQPPTSHPPIDTPPPYSEPRTFTKIRDITFSDLLLAASIFDHVARGSNIKYAIVGGVSAHIFEGWRQTESLDILLAPHLYDGRRLIRPLINELFDANQDVLNYIHPNRYGHIVVVEGNAGVPINFIDCVNNTLGFPDLVALTRPDGTQWNQDDPEPTYSFQRIHPPGVQEGILVPVVLPRPLLFQRLLHFSRPSESDEVTRKVKDVKDITTYLNALDGVEHQSFTDEEALVLAPKVKDVLRFAELYGLDGMTDLGKWGWININLEDEGWSILY